jgi:hypothetical protein
VAARWVRESGGKDAARGSQVDAAEGGSPTLRRLELWTRTHREAVRELIAEGRLPVWHRAAAQTLADTGPLGRAEAAYHAGDAGDGPWAARLALEAAAAAAESRLEGSALRLRAFAEACDPSLAGEEASAADVSVREGPFSRPVDSEPPTIMRQGGEAPPSSGPATPPSAVASDEPVDEADAGATRQRDSVPADVGVLEQRMRAIEELSKGQIAHAVHVLRAEHAKLEKAAASPSALCQASLVLGVALAHAGQNEEALLQGLDALARAREGEDTPGEHACVTFLARLFEGTSHEAYARGLRERALRDA